MNKRILAQITGIILIIMAACLYVIAIYYSTL